MRHLFIILIFISKMAFGEGQVVASGTVPDEASKSGILAQLHQLYGQGNVVDLIEIGTVVMPANWNNYVKKLINPSLKQVKHGQLKIDGNSVSINGEVINELQRQQMASDIATNLDSNYTLLNELRVIESKQNIIDSTLHNRIIEFESGKATFTPKGKALLDELTVPLLGMNYQKLVVVGHTDNRGLRIKNIDLSQARADAVKLYLANKGIVAEKIDASGKGPDIPVADNATSEGRARNRRIEFRIVQ